jgi:hypothetical protein
MKIRPAGTELLHAGGQAVRQTGSRQTERQTDMTKLIVTFCNLGKRQKFRSFNTIIIFLLTTLNNQSLSSLACILFINIINKMLISYCIYLRQSISGGRVYNRSFFLCEKHSKYVEGKTKRFWRLKTVVHIVTTGVKGLIIL